METVCGLIPDSGTTLIAANEQQILKVYEAMFLGQCSAVSMFRWQGNER